MNLTPKQVQDRLRELSGEADTITHRYLRANGWEYSSHNPMCQWLWVKKMEDGRTAMLSEDNALDWQQTVDQEAIDAETGPEERY